MRNLYLLLVFLWLAGKMQGQNVALPTTVYTTQLFTRPITATVADLQINENNISWYYSNKGGTAIPNSTLLVDGGIYYAERKVSNRVSPRLAIRVKFISDKTQGLCPNNATVGNLTTTPTIDGTALWYRSATGGNPIPESTILNSGTYYVSQATVSTPKITTFIDTIILPHKIERLVDGTLLIADDNKILKRFSSTGQFLNVFYTSLADRVHGILQLSNSKVLIGLDLGSQNIIQTNSDGSSPIVFAKGFHAAESFVELSNGTILVSNQSGGNLVKVKLDGTIIEAFFRSSFLKPMGMIQLNSGKIVVADMDNDKILQFDNNGSNLKDFISNVSKPIDIIQLPNKKLWVCTSTSIIEYNDKGKNPTVIASGIGNDLAGLLQISSTEILVSSRDRNKIYMITLPQSYNRVPVQLTIADTAAPKAAAQSFCMAQNATIADLVATGTNIKWYNVATGGTALASFTPLIDGSTYYASQTLNNCESLNRVKVTVKIQTTTMPIVVPTSEYTYGDPTIALTATAETHNKLMWYTQEQGGSALKTAPIPYSNNVGIQEYWVSQITPDGCESARAKITVKVNPAVLTITANNNQTKVYGEADPVFTYTASGYKIQDTDTLLQGKLGRITGEDIGNYTLEQGSLNAGPNYDIAFNSAELNITKATLTITANDHQTKVYGETDPVFTYTAKGFKYGESYTILQGMLSRVTGENVGGYAMEQGSLNAGTNYDILFKSAEFNIVKAPLTVTPNSNQSKVYGDTDPNLNYRASGFKNSDTASILSGELARDSGEQVDVYAITKGSLIATNNYDMVLVDTEFEITKAPLTVTPDPNQSKVYGDTDPKLSFTASGFKNSDTASILSGELGRDPGENVGMYSIKLGLLSGGTNYDIALVNAEFEITKAPLRVTPDPNQSKVYGDTDPNLGYTALGFKNSDTTSILSGELARDPGENVGMYLIRLGSLSGGTNYDIALDNAEFKISKATLRVTPDANQSKVYGDTDPIISYTVTGITNSDAASILSGELARDPGETVGTYAISKGSLLASTNYDIALDDAEFTITKAILTVTPDPNQSKVYGDTDPKLSYSASGFKNSDTASILSGELGRFSGQNVGMYPIVLGSLSGGTNYDIALDDAEFEITKAIIEVTADTNQSKVYGQSDPRFSYTASGFKSSDTMGIFFGELNRVAGQDVGLYAVELGTLSAGINYDILFNSADFNITKANLTITANSNQTKVFGQVDPVLTYSVSGLQYTDNPSILTGALTRQVGEDVGLYGITQGSLIANSNYELHFISAEFSITKATLQGITLSDASFGYDSGVKSLSISGVLPSGTSVTYQNNSHVNIGTYNVIAQIDGGLNYFDLVLEAVLTITKGTIKSVSFSNASFTYDGTLKSLAIKGTLPVGTSVSYQNNDHISAGDYTVTAFIDGGVNYHDLTLKAQLTIRKADITGISFDPASFVYDGLVKALAIVGSLPAGATVTYQNNAHIDAGSYTVTANIQGGDNYNSLRLTAKLTIDKANQSIGFDLPSPVILEEVTDYQLNALASSKLPVTYSYSYTSDTAAASVSPTGWLEFVQPGSIVVTVEQGGNKNYHPAPSVTKNLEIQSKDASIHSLSIDNMDFEFASDLIVYTLDCNNLEDQIVVRIKTQKGASVDPSHEFVIEVPDPGVYKHVVRVTSQNGQESKQYVIQIEKPFLFSYIAQQKYDNVLLINNNPKTNGGYRFVGFKWFKNDVLVGEKQVYSEGNTPKDLLDPLAVYRAELTTDSGQVIQVCPALIRQRAAYQTKLYPSPAQAGQAITVSISYPLEQLVGQRLDIFDSSGKHILSTSISQEHTELVLPGSLQAGTYMAVFKLSGQHKVIHFTVQ